MQSKHHRQLVDGAGHEILWLGGPYVSFQFLRVPAGIEVQAVGVGLADGPELGIERGVFFVQAIPQPDQAHVIVVRRHRQPRLGGQLPAHSEEHILNRREVVLGMGVGQAVCRVGVRLAENVRDAPLVADNLHIVLRRLAKRGGKIDRRFHRKQPVGQAERPAPDEQRRQHSHRRFFVKRIEQPGGTDQQELKILCKRRFFSLNPVADELPGPSQHKHRQRSAQQRERARLDTDAQDTRCQAEVQHPQQAAKRQEQIINRGQADEDSPGVQRERKLVAERGRNLDAPKQPNEAQRNQRHANEVNESVRLILMKLLVTGDQSVQFSHIGQVAA